MITNKNLISFNLRRKITDNSYRSDQILKTSASDTERCTNEIIIQQFIQKSKQRQQTSQFINSNRSHSNALKSMLTPLQNDEIIRLSSPKSSKFSGNNQNFFQKMLNVTDNISKRQQVLEVERQFTSTINQDNRNEYLTKIEQFIRDLLFEEFRELSFLFNSFVREITNNLKQQQMQLNIDKKLFEQRISEQLIQQKQVFDEKLKHLEQRFVSTQLDLSIEKNKCLQQEKDQTDLKNRNTNLIQKVEQRNKLINIQDKKIKQQESEIQILKQKLTCFENKLNLSYKKISFLNRQQSIISNSPQINNDKLNQDEQINDSNTSNSINFDQNDLKEEEQLNQIEINFERIIKQAQKEQQVEFDLLPFYSKEQEQQTDLIMIDPQFDYINQQNVSNATKYAEFIQKVGRKSSEDSLLDQIIDETYDQMDTVQTRKMSDINKSQFSMLKSGISQQNQQLNQPIPLLIRCDSNIINNQIIPQQVHKKENKQKQVLSFITFLKSRMQQQELELQELNAHIQEKELTQIQLDEQLKCVKIENEKLQVQLADYNTKLSQLQITSSLTDFKQEEEVHQSQDSQIPVLQKRTSILLKPGTMKESKKQRKAPQLGQKVVIQYDFQKDQVKKILEKLKLKQMNKFNNFMPLKLVLKYIATLYNEKLQSQKEQKQVKDQDMASYIYNYYLSQYGFTKVTEQKFLVLLLSIKKNIKIVRVNVFAKFLGLVEQNVNYTVEELAKYLEALDFMNTQQNLGQNIKDNESDLKMYIPFVRALSYISQLIFSPTNEELSQLKQEIEQLKENDPKNINKQGIIDFDLMMIKVLQVYRNNIEKTKLYVINAFAASDLDGNGMCNLDEFLLLNKYIEPDKYDEDKWIEVFDDNADINTEAEKALSFERFSILCMEYNLFSDQSQNKFLQIKNNADCLAKFEQLRQLWTNEFISYSIKLQNAYIDEQQKEQWSTILEVLNQKIVENPEQKKPLLIAYKIFLNESKVNKS